MQSVARTVEQRLPGNAQCAVTVWNSELCTVSQHRRFYKSSQRNHWCAARDTYTWHHLGLGCSALMQTKVLNRSTYRPQNFVNDCLISTSSNALRQ